ncbi:MAG: phosphatase PAP2 family protein [Erysipelotrichaceae bacterium]|nr:phosphatase PAP2 family protein [Erysipelotrichaceae bacterium]
MKKKNMIIAAALLAVTVVFCILVFTVDKAPIGPNETVVGFSKLNGFFHEKLPLVTGLYKLTNYLGYLAILVCLFFGGIGFLQLVFRKSLAKVDKVIIVVGVLYVIVIALYVIFEKIPMNFRPVIMPGETEPEASFPSSHTLLAMTVFGSAPWVLDDFFPEENYRRIYKPVFYALAVITVIGRLLSGVHWFTDIIAAALISLTLLAAFKAALDEIK